MPPEYKLQDEAQLPELAKLLSAGQLRRSSVGGLTFGAVIPEYKGRGVRVSYPSGPTWQASFSYSHARQSLTPLADMLHAGHRLSFSGSAYAVVMCTSENLCKHGAGRLLG
jgi:hypothetical protein